MSDDQANDKLSGARKIDKKIFTFLKLPHNNTVGTLLVLYMKLKLCVCVCVCAHARACVYVCMYVCSLIDREGINQSAPHLACLCLEMRKRF
jgi:hypothetical protein